MRRKVEGWAADVDETDAQVGRASLRQRLSDNNKLWLISLLAVVLVTGYLVKGASRPEPDVVRSPSKAPADYTDSAHKDFERELMQGKLLGLSATEVTFVKPDQLRIVVPGNASRDDIDHAAIMAGDRILAKFGFHAVVQVYRREANGKVSPAAIAQWEPKNYGFVARHPKN